MSFRNYRRTRAARSPRLAKASVRHQARRLLFETCESRDLFAADLRLFLWHDFGGNGLRNIGDHGLPGGVVELYSTTDSVVGNADDVSLGTAVTDDRGFALFTGLDASLTYFAQFRPPVGQQGDTPSFSFTVQDAAIATENGDSDVDSAGLTGLLQLQDGVVSDDVAAGVVGNELIWGWAGGIENTPGVFGQSNIYDVAVDSQGFVYATGITSGTIDFDLGPGVETATGFTSAFVAKYTPEGALVWIHSLQGPSDGESLAIDGDDNVVVVGRVFASDFDPGPGVANLQADTFATFVWKLDSDGNYLWAQLTGGAATLPKAVEVNAAGEIVVSGSFTDGTVNFPATGNLSVSHEGPGGAGNWYLWRLAADGQTQWAGNLGRILPTNGVDIDSTGRVAFTGYFSGTIDADPSPAEHLLTAPDGTLRPFTVLLDQAGALVWVQQNQSFANNLVIDSQDRILVGGAGQYTRFTSDGTVDKEVNFFAYGDLVLDSQDNVYVSSVREIIRLDATGQTVWDFAAAQRQTFFNGNLVIGPNGDLIFAAQLAGTVLPPVGNDFDVTDGTFSLPRTDPGHGILWKIDSAALYDYEPRVFEGSNLLVPLDDTQHQTFDWDLDNDGQYDDYTGPYAHAPWSALQAAGVTSKATPHVFGVSILDSQGQRTNVQGRFTVQNLSPAFDAVTIPANGFRGFEVAVSALARDNGGDAITGSILVTGPNDFSQTFSGLSASFTPPATGDYTVKITATDGIEPVTYTGTVHVSNKPPQVGPFNVAANFQFDVDVPLPVSGGPIVEYSWDLDHDGDYDFTSGTTLIPADVLLQNGYFADLNVPVSHTVGVRLKDSDGEFGTGTGSILENTAPRILSLVNPHYSRAGFPATFVVNFDDITPALNGQPVVIEWKVTDSVGNVTTSPLQAFQYTSPDGKAYQVDLSVTDGDGGVSTTTIQVPEGPPVISSLQIPEFGTEGTAIAISGTVYDPSVVVHMTVSGPNNFSRTFSSLNATFTPPEDGNYFVTITADDGAGGKATSTGTIQADNANPVISDIHVPANALEGKGVNISADVTDPGTDDVTTTTIQINGPNGYFLQLAGSQTQFTPQDDGHYTVVFLAGDGEGGTEQATAEFDVVNAAPVIGDIHLSRGPYLEGGGISFAATVFDPGDDAVTTKTVITGPNNFVRTINGSSGQFAVPDNGTYTISMTADDGEGGLTVKTQTVDVGSVAPIIKNIRTVKSYEGKPVTMTAIVADVASDPLIYRWLITGPDNFRKVLTGETISYLAGQNGQYQVTLKVIDDEGVSSTTSSSFSIANAPPAITGFLVPPRGKVGESVHFSARARDVKGDTLIYAWTVSGPNQFVQTLRGQEVDFFPPFKGRFTVTLIVSDGDGAVVQRVVPFRAV